MGLGYCAIAGCVLVLASGGADTRSVAFGQDAPIAWSEMGKFFVPPEQYQGRLGEYRSFCWEKWYLGYEFDRPADKQRTPGVPQESNPRTGAYKRLVADGRDLHELHALIAPRPFLVSGGAQDRPEYWTALNHAIALNEFLGHTGRVAMTMREGHTPTPQSNAQVYTFLEHFLKAH